MRLLPYHDDADVPIGLHPAGLRAAILSLLPRTAGKATSSAISIIFRGETLVAVSAILLLGVIAALMLQQTGTGMWLLLFSPIASSLLTAVVGTAFTLGLLLARLRSRIARVQLQNKRCPACNYDLRGIVAPSTPSAMITCTECGTHWRATRLGQPADAPPQIVIIRKIDQPLT